MKFGFSWLNARRSLIFASLIELYLFVFLFIKTFRYSILNNPTIISLTFASGFLWIVSSYIIGRYSFTKRGNKWILINTLFRTGLNIFFNVFLNQFIFRLFWNWNYMNFESFSNFLNDFSSFYIKVFLVSTFVQYIINIFVEQKYPSKSIWLFLGSPERQKYLKELIGLSSRFKIELFNQEYLTKAKLNCKGIIIDDNEILEKKNVKFLFNLNNRGIKFMKVSYWCERYLNRYPSELVQVSEIIDGNFSYNEYSFKARIKRIGELILSLIILILTLPILLLSAILIKLDDGGPIFYSQIRNGFEGKQFQIIKLRTMVINAEKNGVQWAKKSDQRITNIGKILRKLRIDELPQLWLVISGEMSLIGPRPERPEIDDLLRDHLQNYDIRYSIKPGISGWAQVNFPYGASIEDSRYKLSYDIYYIKNFSILLDCIIFFKTIRLVFSGKGSIPKKR